MTIHSPLHHSSSPTSQSLFHRLLARLSPRRQQVDQILRSPVHDHPRSPVWEAHAMLSDIKRLRTDVLGMSIYGSQHHEALSFLLREGYLRREDLVDAVRYALYEHVRTLVKSEFFYTRYADHCGMEELLAFAISEKWLAPKEISRIRFDHWDTPETFADLYGHCNLAETMVHELVTGEKYRAYKSSSPSGGALDTDCFCSH